MKLSRQNLGNFAGHLTSLLLNVIKAAFLWPFVVLLSLNRQTKIFLLSVIILGGLILFALWTPRSRDILATKFNKIAQLVLRSSRSGAVELDLPFGFRFGDSTVRIETLLNNSLARITSKKAEGDREIWLVEGLIHAGIKRTAIAFEKNALTDVELRCQSDAWPLQRYLQGLEEIRANFDQNYQENAHSTPLLSRARASAENRVGYGWKFFNGSLALYCRSFRSPSLSVSDLIVHYGEHDFELARIGEIEDPWSTRIASPVIAQKLRPQPDGTESILGISNLNLLNASALTKTFLRLDLDILLKSNAQIDPTKAVVHVFFYDILNGREVVLTDAEVNYEWRSRRDWKQSNPEKLTITYSREPKPDAPEHNYFGYIAVVYYDGQLQSVRADPVPLLNLFAPRTFISPFEDAQAAIARGDYVSAAELYEKIAGQGNLWAAENLAWFYAHGKGVSKDYRKAVAFYEKATLQNSPRAFNGLAWFLATCPDDAIRNGKEAVNHALKACELSYWRQWGTIDTLAAAYAETGDFDQAIAYQNLALNIKDLKAETRSKMEERLKLYQQKQAWRE